MALPPPGTPGAPGGAEGPKMSGQGAAPPASASTSGPLTAAPPEHSPIGSGTEISDSGISGLPSPSQETSGPDGPASVPADTGVWLAALRRIISTLGPQTPFQTSLSSLLGILGSLGFLRPHLILFEPETGQLRLSLAESPPTDSQAGYNPGEGVTGRVFSTGKPVIVECLASHDVFQNRIFQRTHEEMERLSFISVPVLTPASGGAPLAVSDVVGTLNADTPFVSQADLRVRCQFLEVLASLIANEAAYMQEEMARQRRLAHALDENGAGLRPAAPGDASGFVARSKVMRHILEQAAHLAQGRTPVLLRGEAGSGKARLASRIHAMSPRRDLPMLVYHCAAAAPERQEADLRGCLKGAMEGAARTVKGLFEQAHSGTLFLEAVEALSQDAQEALLRLVSSHEVLRRGAREGIPVDVRIIASSAADLEQAVEDGGFHRELYTRLGLGVLHVPPLRERREDIIPLAELELALSETGTDAGGDVKRISFPALELLTRYFWPGNIPELKSCMARALESSEDHVIRAKDLPPSLQTAQSSATESALSLGEAVARFEKELLVDALIKSGGNMLKAAKDLDSSYRIVNYKVKKYRIDPQQFTFRGQ